MAAATSKPTMIDPALMLVMWTWLAATWSADETSETKFVSKTARAAGLAMLSMLWLIRKLAENFAGLRGMPTRSMVMVPSEVSSPSLTWNRKLVEPALPAGW